ncbi:MAG: hypothetical protein A2430_02410 [Candidatus Liptonbacteria bacterium RIFOXYC1_FULL_36_8]|uniref:Methionine--tRNA ligase n=2 Tax=Candidatus Liptoniibacteriota TaxID=1817909 RepID=A0A1G2CRX1_9BACT|nr:MAG: hypothetical protein A2430_02410 [Candidatus Liptonbacteria bacterium RIFOXYC1_FULL_36_8]OGZ03615.1 MAG: hypothetical protein A2604_02035 [Candidatus Liptonbacteria bacterium RIFOXYD1_FULL_36_11]
MISFDYFQKIELKIGAVIFAEKIDGSDKLLKLLVDFGEEKLRQVVSGIAKTFSTPEKLIGKQFIFITNLEPRTIFGLESQAMILASQKKKKSGAEEIILIKPAKKIPPGSLLH